MTPPRSPAHIARETYISVAVVLSLLAGAVMGTSEFQRLSSAVAHLSESVRELHQDLRALADRENSNGGRIALIMERMQADDAREIAESEKLAELTARLISLEQKVGK
jgi:outer membrane murein-binding lipoprotein Lpp